MNEVKKQVAAELANSKNFDAKALEGASFV